jgi:hypothetical protein
LSGGTASAAPKETVAAGSTVRGAAAATLVAGKAAAAPSETSTSGAGRRSGAHQGKRRPASATGYAAGPRGSGDCTAAANGTGPAGSADLVAERGSSTARVGAAELVVVAAASPRATNTGRAGFSGTTGVRLKRSVNQLMGS